MRFARVIPVFLVAMPALAAQVTEVAGSMNESDGLAVDLKADFQHRHDSTRIRRENLQSGTICTSSRPTSCGRRRTGTTRR
jgi:hypothetical protein